MPQLLELEELVVRAQGGDGGAYENIVSRFQDMALNYAYSLVGDYDLAEDVKQEAFITAYCGLLSLRNPQTFPAWFRQIIHRHSIDLRRGRQILTVPLIEAAHVEDGQPTAYRMIEEQETREAIQQALSQLPEEERQATELFYLEERPINEICAMFGVSREAIKSRLHSARTRLRQRSILMAKDSVRKKAPADAKKLAQAASTEAVSMFDEELKLLVQSPSPEQQRVVDLVCAKGRLLRFAGKMDEALVSFKEAMTWPAAKAAPIFEARLRAEIGFTYIRKSDYALARSEFDFSRKVLVKEQEPSILSSDILNGLGMCAWEEGDFKKARKFYEQALKISRTNNHKVSEANLTANLALIDWKSGYLDKAIKGFRLSSRYWNKIGDKYHLSQIQMQIGIIEENLGRFADANQHYREALDLAISIKYVLLQSYIYLNLANLALNQQKWDLAEQYSRESISIAKQVNNPYVESLAFENLALSQLGLGQLAEAEDSIRESKRIAQSMGNQERLAILSLVEVETKIALKQTDGLLGQALRAKTVIEAKGYISALPWALRLIAHAHILEGDHHQARQSLDLGFKECKRQKSLAEARKLKRLESHLNRLISGTSKKRSSR